VFLPVGFNGLPAVIVQGRADHRDFFLAARTPRNLAPLKNLALLQIKGSLGEIGGAAQVAPVVFVGAEGEDFFSLTGEAEVGVDDGEDAYFGEHGEQARGNDVDAGEGEGKWRGARGEGRVDGWSMGSTATKLELIVKKEEAGGFAGLDGEGGESAVLVVELEHRVEVDGADDVDVVDNEWFWHRVACTFKEKPGGFFEAAAGVEQKVIFAGNFDAHAKVVVRLKVVKDHFGKVVDVDDDFADAESAKARESNFKERAAVDFDEGFGQSVGERAQARAKTSGEDHGFHRETRGESRVASNRARKSDFSLRSK